MSHSGSAHYEPTAEEWRVAWRRLRRDYKIDRTFVTRPFVELLVERNWTEYHEYLRDSAQTGWVPRAARVCYDPKGGGLVRPGAVLSLDDEIYYCALLGAMYAPIRDALAWSRGNPDLANRMRDASDCIEWVEPWIKCLRQWRDLSNKRLAESQYVVFTDVAGCYDNLDLARLASELRSMGCSADVVQAVGTCLNLWALPRARGIPQGYTASDLLAKAHLGAVDARLQSERITHLRYVDDIRIFSSGYGEALRAVELTTHVLRACGLDIQSAKTDILRSDSDEAREKVDGVAAVVKGVEDQLRSELGDVPYVTLQQLQDLASTTPDAPPREILEEAWVQKITPERVASVDKTLLRFLLPRLAATGSSVATPLIPRIIRERPEEFATCLAYVSRCARDTSFIAQIPELLNHDGHVYERSVFLLLRWCWTQRIWHPDFLEIVRKTVSDRNKQPWTRAYAMALAARHGDRSDLDRFVDLYGSTEDEIERSEIIMCTDRMESSRRNSFLGRVAGESMWCSWAAQAVRGGVVEPDLCADGPK